MSANNPAAVHFSLGQQGQGLLLLIQGDGVSFWLCRKRRYTFWCSPLSWQCWSERGYCDTLVRAEGHPSVDASLWRGRQWDSGTGGPSLWQSPSIRAAWLCCDSLLKPSLPHYHNTLLLKMVPVCVFLCSPLAWTGTHEKTEAHILGKLLRGSAGAAGRPAACCSHSCWRVINCMGCLVQVPWSRFIITYVILANVKWIVRAELRQLQTCTLFKTVPWCCAGILLGWLELGSQDSVGHLLL